MGGRFGKLFRRGDPGVPSDSPTPRKKRGDRVGDKTVKLKGAVVAVLDRKGNRGESYSDVVLRALKKARWA
ncbi:hypothetical protein ES703_43474 [subsurface metagenome]